VNERAYTPSEMMIVASARQLAGERVCFVGIGPPNIACNLAKRTVSPDLELVYEAGVFGAAPLRLPLSIGDPSLVTGSVSVTSMFEIFAYYLQRGLIDVAFLGASQIDRHGNINTTVIGDYAKPKVRLPGSGGACEISINARKTFVIMPQSKRSFVDEVDFVTSPGHLAGTRPREWLGAGPSVVVTGLGVYRFSPVGRMYLASTHPGVTVEEVRDNTSWDLDVTDDLEETRVPSSEELRLVREELDPEGIYSG
jgi:glutaconate CoA-transferase, subunit B